VVLDNHRRSDWTPYVYRTTSFGKSWTSLASDSIRGYALTIVQDPSDPDLLFLGTEFGLYVSLDSGAAWMPWTHGVPTVSVMDLAIQSRESDLVIGTHGRGAYILDDFSPLRTVTEELLVEPVHLFEVPDARQHWVRQTDAPRFPGHGEFRGENRSYGATITFSLHADDLPSAEELEPLLEKEKREKIAASREQIAASAGKDEDAPSSVPKAKITILDAGGDEIRSFETPAHVGVNRAVWDLRRDPFREPPRERPWWRDEPTGPEVLPGTYSVRVEYGDHESTGEVRVLPDPRMEISDADRAAKRDAVDRAGRLQEVIAEAVARIVDLRADAEVVKRKVEAERKAAGTPGGKHEGSGAQLLEAAKSLDENLSTIEGKLWIAPDAKGIPPETDAFSRLNYVTRSLASSWDAPTAAQIAYLDQVEAFLATTLEEHDRFFATEVADFRELVEAAGFELVPAEEPLSEVVE
jgi:hypothetical protein